MKWKLGRLAKCIDRFGLRGGSKIYWQLKTGHTERINVPGIGNTLSLRKNGSDKAVFEQVFLDGDYDLDLSFAPGTIIDAGANIGLFSALMKNRFPQARFFCIEPDEANCHQLRKNLAGYSQVDILCAALWKETTTLKIVNRFKDNPSAYSVAEDPEGLVEAIRIDQIMQRYELKRIDLLKIDIEGAESTVFSENYAQWLPKVRMIVIELHDWLQAGCSSPFFEAVQKTFSNYRYGICGENTVIENLDLYD
jgi:FkbM family methyltransferase